MIKQHVSVIVKSRETRYKLLFAAEYREELGERYWSKAKFRLIYDW